jgi:hypothetical protein
MVTGLILLSRVNTSFANSRMVHFRLGARHTRVDLWRTPASNLAPSSNAANCAAAFAGTECNEPDAA